MTTITVRRKQAFRAVRENNANTLAKSVKNPTEANWRAAGAATGNTLLEYACELGHIEIATWLVENGADIDAYCTQYTPNVKVIDSGNVCSGIAYLGPLTTAIYFKQLAALEFLLRRGVNLDLPWEKHGSRIVTCREFLATNPELFALVEKVLLEIEVATGQEHIRRRL